MGVIGNMDLCVSALGLTEWQLRLLLVLDLPEPPVGIDHGDDFQSKEGRTNQAADHRRGDAFHHIRAVTLQNDVSGAERS